jgi:hypothetical protein
MKGVPFRFSVTARRTKPQEDPRKLLDQVRHTLRLKHSSYRTEQAYVHGITRYIHFTRQGSQYRHPSTLGAAEVEQFLTSLAVGRHVSASAAPGNATPPGRAA